MKHHQDPPGDRFVVPGNYIQTLRYFPTQDKALGEVCQCTPPGFGDLLSY